MKLYVDLNKAILDKSKLVQRQVLVHGQNGKTFSRKQWVDPSTGQPVSEESGNGDNERQQFNSLPNDKKEQAVQSYINQNKERAHKFAQVTGMRRDPSTLPSSTVKNHIMQNADKLPMEHIKPHIPAQSPSAPLAVEHTDDHGLSDVQVEKNHGRVGPLDLDKLYEGRSILDAFEDDLNESQSEYDYNHEGDPDSPITDVRKEWTNLFGGITKQGFEHAFSVPGKVKARMVNAFVQKTDESDVAGRLFFNLYTPNDERMGAIERSVSRNEDGSITVHNDVFELHQEHQGKGVASDLYNGSEQLWRHLSKGHPVHISLNANISVGVYSWATKGFDFATDEEHTRALNELTTFLKDNDMKEKEVMEACGYNSIDDLENAWQFASLDDGKKYTIGDVETTSEERHNTRSEVDSKPMHLGKAFMLAGKSDWEGIKTLNAGTAHEEIGGDK